MQPIDFNILDPEKDDFKEKLNKQPSHSNNVSLPNKENLPRIEKNMNEKKMNKFIIVKYIEISVFYSFMEQISFLMKNIDKYKIALFESQVNEFYESSNNLENINNIFQKEHIEKMLMNSIVSD